MSLGKPSDKKSDSVGINTHGASNRPSDKNLAAHSLYYCEACGRMFQTDEGCGADGEKLADIGWMVDGDTDE